MDPERRRGGELGLPDHGFIGAGLHRAGVEEQADGYATARRRFLPVLSQLALITQSAPEQRQSQPQAFKGSKCTGVTHALQSVPLPRGPVRHSGVFAELQW